MKPSETEMKLLYNARVHTLDERKPAANVILIDGDHIVSVGGKELYNQFQGKEKEDLQGRTILPGLIDAHLHLQEYAMSFQKVDCETKTRSECLRRVAEHANRIRDNSWVLGHGWNQNIWPEGFGTATDIDELVPDRPVYLTAKSLHASWVNSCALRLAGINAQTMDPKNGIIQRDDHGQPSGILFEKASRLVEDVIPAPDTDLLANAIKDIQVRFWSHGLTAVHDFDRSPTYEALNSLNESYELYIRVVKNIHQDEFQKALTSNLCSGFGDDMLKIGSVKLFADGALGPHTAAMLESYDDDRDNLGVLLMNAEELVETYGRPAADGRLSLAVHAIGDRANREVLDALVMVRDYEKKRGYAALRHRIEHVQLIHPRDAPRLAELGIIASMQPVHATSDMEMADSLWGKRCLGAYANRTILKSGAHMAFGSDAPVESPNPFLGLHAAVTRRRQDGSPGEDGWHPQQRLSLTEALQGFTTGPAYAASMEDRQGKLKDGYYADLIVLDSDPFSCAQDEICDLQPVATMVAGKWVWRN